MIKVNEKAMVNLDHIILVREKYYESEDRYQVEIDLKNSTKQILDVDEITKEQFYAFLDSNPFSMLKINIEKRVSKFQTYDNTKCWVKRVNVVSAIRTEFSLDENDESGKDLTSVSIETNGSSVTVFTETPAEELFMI